MNPNNPNFREELKPCAFCGGKVGFDLYENRGYEFTTIRCGSCDLMAFWMIDHSDQQLVEAWNKRA